MDAHDIVHTPYVSVWFRPRILRDVSTVDWSTTILGQNSSLPVYIVGNLTLGSNPRHSHHSMNSLQLLLASWVIPMANSV